MSKSLQIRNGDLVVGGGRSYDLVSGVNKLAQDLELWVLERIGIDPATPTYGNRLDGGIINEQPVGSFIGEVSTEERVMAVREEILDLLGRYQAMQLAKLQREAALFNGNHTLEENEVLHTINSVRVTQDADQIICRVNCTTLSGANVDILIPVTA